MGVAVTTAAEATNTPVASNINPLTSGIPEWNITGSGFSFGAGGMTATAGATAWKPCASGHKGFDVSWRWKLDSNAEHFFDTAATLASAQGTGNGLASALRVQTGGGVFYIVSWDASAAFTIHYQASLPLGTYDIRSVVTEAGLWTVTLRDVVNGTTTVVMDAVDITTRAFWTQNTGTRSWHRYRCQTAGGLTVSNLREASHPASEPVRSQRGSLLQLSDGTSAWVQATAGAATTTVSVWRDRKDGTAPYALASWSVTQRLWSPPIMARDASDNLFVALGSVSQFRTRAITKSGSTWTLSPNTSTVGDQLLYLPTSLVWANTGGQGHLIVTNVYTNTGGIYSYMLPVTNVINGGSVTGNVQSSAISTRGDTRKQLASMDTFGATTGVLVVPQTLTTLRVYRLTATTTAPGITSGTDVTVPATGLSCVSLVRVGTGKWVLTTLDSSQRLTAYVITATSATALTVSAAIPSTAVINGEQLLGFGDAFWDGTRVNQVMPADYGASQVTTDYVRARFDPASNTWVAPAPYLPVGGQAKEEVAHVSTGPISLAPESVRADGLTDWLITSLGQPGGGGSTTYTVHDTDSPRPTVSGVVQQANGSPYLGGALLAVVRSDGTVAVTGTSSTADGSYSLPLPTFGTFEVVAFTPDGALTAAVGVKATA